MIADAQTAPESTIPASAMHLVLFLSRATPLARWERMGIFEREVALYRRLANRLGRVSIVTSGGADELRYAERLEKIQILPNRWRLPPNLYSLLAPVLHADALREATIFKTNQLDGAWTAILAGKLHRKPVVVRAGYLWAEDHRREGGVGIKAALIERLQRWSFRRADAIFLTTAEMRDHVAATYPVAAERIRVAPNYVDTARFRSLPAVESVPGRICYVGRLHPRKNLDLLIRAVAQIPDASLVLIGRGEQRAALAALADQVGARVTVAGGVPHKQLPAEINRAQVFVLPSAFEGHPKALLEAMACGVAVLGTNVPGIREEIAHGENGWLCDATVDSLAGSLRHLLDDAALRQRLGARARAYIVDHYSLDRIADLEIQALQRICAMQRK
jgi:glycosyltransferase involved in cell wall biosynthesis